MVKHARRAVFIASARADDAAAEALAAIFSASFVPATGFWAAPQGRGREVFVADALEAPTPVLILWSKAALNSPRILSVAGIAARDSRLFEAILVEANRVEAVSPEADPDSSSLRSQIPLFPDRLGRFDPGRRIFALSRAGSRDNATAAGDESRPDETGQLQAALELFVAAPQIRPVSVAPKPFSVLPRQRGFLVAGTAGFGLMAGLLALQGGPLGAAAYEKLYAAIDLNGAIRGLQRGSDSDAVAVDPDLAPPETRSWAPDLAGFPPEIARAAALARAAREKGREAAREAEKIAAEAERIARDPNSPELRRKEHIFRGEIRGGTPAGIGRREFPDGARFWGTEGKSGREGPGVFLFADRETFHGEFRGDFPNGYGRYGFADGTRYEGRFAGGSIAGYGVLVFPDGRRFEGAFADNPGALTYEGPGIYWPRRGRPVHGIWRGGKLAGKWKSRPERKQDSP